MLSSPCSSSPQHQQISFCELFLRDPHAIMASTTSHDNFSTNIPQCLDCFYPPYFPPPHSSPPHSPIKPEPKPSPSAPAATPPRPSFPPQSPTPAAKPPHSSPSPPKVAPPHSPIKPEPKPSPSAPAATPPHPSILPPSPTPAAKPPHSSIPPPSPTVTPPPRPSPPAKPPRPISPPAKPPHSSIPPPVYPRPPPASPPVGPIPLPPPAPGHHSTVIVVVFVSLGGLFFLAFLSVALCCFIKKRKKRMEQKTEVINFDEHVKVQEAIVPGPHGEQMKILTIEEDVHVDEVIKKTEKELKDSHIMSAHDDHLQAIEAAESSSGSTHHHLDQLEQKI